jgi:hypothetical protein
MRSPNFKINIDYLYGLNETINSFSTPTSEPVTLIIEKMSDKFDPYLLREKVVKIFCEINYNISIYSKIKEKYESNPFMVDSPDLMKKCCMNYIMESAKMGSKRLISAINKYIIDQSKK